ncbi:MAG: phosphoribosylglycinamide formyltransferase [Chitinophagales bacterium]|nr:phosphoribosylglycinamide formyltransferase [Chitinophagales bacterium]
MKKRIAIFASGAGSNAKAIIDYFKHSEKSTVAMIATNNPNAGVLEIAIQNNIDTFIFSKEDLQNESFFLKQLSDIDFIVLAGFLWLIPSYLVKHFPNRIINIHPALLPKFGGKGMYGMRVHEAVYASHETETGITIHFVNEHYDEGTYIMQQKVSIDVNDTPESIANKVLQLEHQWYPKAVEQTV